MALAPAELPGLGQIDTNRVVRCLTLLVSLVCGLVVGLLPALCVTRSNLQGLLKGISWSSGSAGVKERRILGSLGMVEVALSLVLLLGASLTLRSFWRVSQVELGIDTDNILCARIMGSDLTKNHQALLDALKGLPGIEAVSTTTALPLTDEMSDFATPIPVDATNTQEEAFPQISLRTISQDYFRVMGIALLQGEGFNSHNNKTSDRVIIINQRLAQRLWPDKNPIGQHLRFGDVMTVLSTDLSEENEKATYRIVGVIQDVKYQGPEAVAPMEAYMPMSQGFRGYVGISLAIRCQSASMSYVETITQKVEVTCPGSTVVSFSTMQGFLAQRTSVRRFIMTLLLTFTGIALSLSVVGIYSVTSHTVSARMREVGIRMAFGAEKQDVLKLFLKQGMRCVLGGLALGLGLALILHQTITSQLYGISALDPVTLVGCTVLIVLISAVACFIPARRASQADPMEVLRYE